MVQTIKQAMPAGGGFVVSCAIYGNAAPRTDRWRQPMAEASKTNPQGAERLGYLGLGLMGTPMSRRLLNAGHQVTVWNRSEGKMAALVEAGARGAATPPGS